jgi:hypothetical protein
LRPIWRRRKGDAQEVEIVQWLRGEATETLPWTAARLCAGTWKSRNAELHGWMEMNESVFEESGL